MPSTQRVFIGNIPSDCRERDIEKFFKGYGKLGEISIKNGFGFVDFDDYRDAEDAVQDLNGKEMSGAGRLRVELARDRNSRDRDRDRDRDRSSRRGSSPRRFGGGRDSDRDRGGRGGRGNPPGRRTPHRLTVENLSSKTSWQDLKDFFRVAGDITYTNAHKPRQGEGVVEFADRRGMDYALEKLDNTDLDGRRIRLVEEKRSSRRSRSASRSPKSRSRSRSRS